MMNAKAPDLTPPGKNVPLTKTEAAQVAQKEVKAPKEKKETKPRTPRTDYGFSLDSTIRIVKGEGKENKYRGHRKEWYDSLVKFENQKVSAWADSRKDLKDPPRGWLRFFVQDGTVSLTRPPMAAATETKAA